MNIVFRLPEEGLEKEFVAASEAAGMVGLKGHRSVGGLRASLYYALPMASVEYLGRLYGRLPGLSRMNGRRL